MYMTAEAPGCRHAVPVTRLNTQPKLNVHGGYHDAGDADRRGYHLMVPIVLMTTYEVFPNLFTDNQFNIPDIFDANFNIVGQGNGIPDILDEAVWGTMLWTNLQIPPENLPARSPGAVMPRTMGIRLGASTTIRTPCSVAPKRTTSTPVDWRPGCS